MLRAISLLLLLATIVSCKKNKAGLETESGLVFSTQEVFFDTVFTGIGSATEIFKVYNPSDKEIKISRVFLEGGSGSEFRFNLDGVAGDQNDITIAGKDSIFGFVEVTVNTGFKDNPFVIEDYMVFITNGKTQKVKTVAWGQDAYYYFPDEVVQGLPAFSRIINYKLDPTWNDEFIWKNDKPHVIYGYLRVDSSLTLKIEKGTQIHLHDRAGLWIAKGASLKVEGEKDEEVVFQGDRLEEAFAERPGQWDRIWINEGGTSSIRYAIIKNGYVGLQVETTPFDPDAVMSNNKLTLQKTIIRNMVGVGLITRNFKIDAENCLFYEIGNQDLAINGGGEYSFKHCTFANYWSGSNRQNSLLFINNYYQDINGVQQEKDLKATFDNCIFYGNKEEEIELDSSAAVYDLTFNHCVLKTEIDIKTHGTRYVNCIANPNNGFNSPVFTNPGGDEYELYGGSAAQEIGDPAIPSTMKEVDDLKAEARDAKPDAGCYEFQK
ncbi:MAG: hypothetical protein CL840_05320 [Crocinitomicaceae bacterium]|nr:hypothetical protein [Crocinitomicaceae bacterium]|tara:strand:- start:4615 stop:6090 length:1476 start_codon:yes stop_codon:yes gene_type:complete